MDEIAKTFLGFFLILVICFIGTGLITASVDISKAKEYQKNIVTEIENSHFSSTVMEKCKEDATNKGYKLEYKNIKKDDFNNTVSVEIILTYKYSIPLLGNIGSEHSLRSFAN